MELLRALAVLAEPPRESHRGLRTTLQFDEEPDAAAHTDLFAFQLVPYAAAFLNADGMLGGAAQDRVAGFRRALGYPPAREPDALVELLTLYAHLAEREVAQEDLARRAMLQRARAALLWEHLAPWLFVYADTARRIAAPFYRRWAELLLEALACAVADCGTLEHVPVHLDALPPMPDPQEAGAEEYLAALLAPARSGVVLTRADLRRAATEIGLGLRQGERRYILRALLGQDGDATLQWLASEASLNATRHAALEGVPALVREFWVGRATATAEMLRSVRTVSA